MGQNTDKTQPCNGLFPNVCDHCGGVLKRGENVVYTTRPPEPMRMWHQACFDVITVPLHDWPGVKNKHLLERKT